jgi:hypothetical protein
MTTQAYVPPSTLPRPPDAPQFVARARHTRATERWQELAGWR